jgi:hypothetical protein
VLDFDRGGIVLRASFKTQSSISLLGALVIFTCLASTDTKAQTRVKISVSTPNEVVVQAVSPTPLRSWSFRNAYAGALGLAERIERFEADGARKLAVGDYRSDSGAKEIQYVVRMARPSAANVAHVSWLSQGLRLLDVGGFMPQEFETVSMEFSLPSGWTVSSAAILSQFRNLRTPCSLLAVHFGRHRGRNWIVSSAEVGRSKTRSP